MLGLAEVHVMLEPAAVGAQCGATANDVVLPAITGVVGQPVNTTASTQAACTWIVQD